MGFTGSPPFPCTFQQQWSSSVRSHWAQHFDSEQRDATKTDPQMPGTASGKGAFDAHRTWHGERGGTKCAVHATLTRCNNEQRTERKCGRPMGRRGCQEGTLWQVGKKWAKEKTGLQRH